MHLPSNPKPLNERAIALLIRTPEIIEQRAPLTDEEHQAPARVVILPVHTEVLRQVADALREKRNLNLAGTRVPIAALVTLYDLLLACGV